MRVARSGQAALLEFITAQELAIGTPQSDFRY